MVFPKSSTTTTTTPPSSQIITTRYSSKQRSIALFLLFLITFPFLVSHTTLIVSRPQLIDTIRIQSEPLSSSIWGNKKLDKVPRWLEVICGSGSPSVCQKPISIGLVGYQNRFHADLPHGIAVTTVEFDTVSSDVTWKDLFPEWIHEDKPGRCPHIPIPDTNKYPKFDIVVAQLPCRNDEHLSNTSDGHRRMRKGIRDVLRLQVSLVTSRIITVQNQTDREVYAVFIGKCEPMIELFRCDDMVWHEGEYWVFKPRVDKLREMISMPFGTCELALPYSTSSG